jgi:hypothetical protein
MDKVTPCECQMSGFCMRRGVDMTALQHIECQTNPDYFERWDSKCGLSVQFPCGARGEITRITRCTVCGSRDELVEVFSCSRMGECTIHAKGVRTESGAKLIQPCISCSVRD